MSELQLVIVFRPEACADPLGPHAFSPFDGVEILAKLRRDQVTSYVNRSKMHNPLWSFLVVDDMSTQV